MEKFRAEQCRDYFNKLAYIARKRFDQPTYSEEQLSWWLGDGGVPANHLIHERFEEQKLVQVPGMREKFLSIVARTDDKKGQLFYQLISYGEVEIMLIFSMKDLQDNF